VARSLRSLAMRRQAQAVHRPWNRRARRRAQVHVALRGREVLMTRELLDGPRRRAAHRQVRTERVTQDVNSRFDVRASGGPPHQLMGAVSAQTGPPATRAARRDSQLPLLVRMQFVSAGTQSDGLARHPL
jgi:hypothetical protein